MNALTNLSRQPDSARHYRSSPDAEALGLELANCLQLVVPASMTADDRAAWILSAVDALDGIRAAEVSAVSAELRRSVTRPAQIVPEISRLVAERRRRANVGAASMTALEMARGAEERGLPKHYEAWMNEARRRGEVA